MKRVAPTEEDAPVEPVRAFGTMGEYERYFEELARRLLYGRLLKVGKRLFRLLEIEVYCQDHAVHQDMFAHAHPVQKQAQCFYFHRQGSAYRGGTYKGVDFTFGCDNVFGGMLIRTIQDVADGDVVCGPSLVVDKLLELLKCKDVADLVAQYGIDGKHESLCWMAEEVPANCPMYRSHRVGLSLKAKKYSRDVLDMWAKPLRFVREPRLISKHKHYLGCALLSQGWTEAAVATLLGTSKQSVEGWGSALAAGKKAANARKYFGDKMSGVAEIATCYGAALAELQ